MAKAPSAPNKAQLDYALRRLSEIARDKTEAVLNKYPNPEPPSLTLGQFISGVRNGTIKAKQSMDTIVLTNDRYHNQIYVTSMFDVSKITDWKPPVNKVRDDKVARIDAEVQRIKDAIILGSLAEVSALLSQFAAFEA